MFLEDGGIFWWWKHINDLFYLAKRLWNVYCLHRSYLSKTRATFVGYEYDSSMLDSIWDLFIYHVSIHLVGAVGLVYKSFLNGELYVLTEPSDSPDFLYFALYVHPLTQQHILSFNSWTIIAFEIGGEVRYISWPQIAWEKAGWLWLGVSHNR